MKRTRLFGLLLISSFFLLVGGRAAVSQVAPEAMISHVGRSFDFSQTSRGSFESDNPDVARVDKRGHVSFLGIGEAGVIFIDQKTEQATLIRFTVLSGGSTPTEIQKGIDIAIMEWENYVKEGKSIPKSNKYTKWKCGRPCEFGWCGAFVNYSLDMGGVPMQTREKSELLNDGRAAAVREAAVPKILEAFKKMDRISYIPQPGYEVIYGRRGGYATIHVGLVTDVVSLGGGKYVIQTAEGNMGPRIRRYHYIYDAFADNFERNMTMLPKELQTDPETFHYPLHLDGEWYVTAFGQTWY